MQKIEIEIKGGLGNQLFQFSTAIALALENNYSVVANVKWFSTPVNLLSEARRQFLLPSLLPKGYKLRRRTGVGLSDNVFKEHSPNFDPKILEFPLPGRLEGYFQDEKYFRSYREQLKDLYLSDNSISTEFSSLIRLISSPTTAVLHFRRGDFLNNEKVKETHGLLSYSYFECSLAKMMQRTAIQDLVVFSDDLRAAHELAQGLHVNTHTVTLGHPVKEILLMSKGVHYILSNSSFGWWGAWLGESNSSTIIAPKDWYASKELKGISPVPNRWITL